MHFHCFAYSFSTRPAIVMIFHMQLDVHLDSDLASLCHSYSHIWSCYSSFNASGMLQIKETHWSHVWRNKTHIIHSQLESISGLTAHLFSVSLGQIVSVAFINKRDLKSSNKQTWNCKIRYLRMMNKVDQLSHDCKKTGVTKTWKSK